MVLKITFEMFSGAFPIPTALIMLISPEHIVSIFTSAQWEERFSLLVEVTKSLT